MGRSETSKRRLRSLMQDKGTNTVHISHLEQHTDQAVLRHPSAYQCKCFLLHFPHATRIETVCKHHWRGGYRCSGLIAFVSSSPCQCVSPSCGEESHQRPPLLIVLKMLQWLPPVAEPRESGCARAFPCPCGHTCTALDA